MKGEFDNVKIMQWADLIRKANESPLGRKEWCKQNSISESSFYYWQRRIRHYALSKMMSGKQEADVQEIQKLPEDTKSYYEINLSEVTAADTMSSMHKISKGSISIRYGDFSIDVCEGFSDDLLSSVIRVLAHV